MGGGSSEGTNSGLPLTDPFSGLMAVRSEGVISPLPIKQYVYPDYYRGYGNRPTPTSIGASPVLMSSVLRVLLRIVEGF
jgi:hypothetical protein